MCDVFLERVCFLCDLLLGLEAAVFCFYFVLFPPFLEDEGNLLLLYLIRNCFPLDEGPNGGKPSISFLPPSPHARSIFNTILTWLLTSGSLHQAMLALHLHSLLLA